MMMNFTFAFEIHHHTILILFQELVSKLKSEKGKLYPLKCDVSKEDEVKEAFQWIKSNLKRVDILVNNAGVGKTASLSGQYTVAALG